MLEATFVPNYGSPLAPALKGTVWFHARPLSYAFTSAPGDYIGGGHRRRASKAGIEVVLRRHLDALGDGGGCNTSRGTLTIYKITLDAALA